MKDESGVTGIEYSLIALLISVAIVGGAIKLGTELKTAYSGFAGKIPDIGAADADGNR